MREYATKALVLERRPVGEADDLVFLFTEKAGKIVARTKSSRKINSKLAGHIEPLGLIQARIVEGASVKLVDALLLDNFLAKPDFQERIKLFHLAQLVSEYAEDEHPDQELWQALTSGSLNGREVLRCLGFDPEHARCEKCKKAKPERFVLKSSTYLCLKCLPIIHPSRHLYAV